MTIRTGTSPRFAGFAAPEGEPPEEEDDLMAFVDQHASGVDLTASDDDEDDEDDDEEFEDDEDDDEDEDEADDEENSDEANEGRAITPNPLPTLDSGTLTAQWVDRGGGVFLMRITGDLYAQVNEEQRGSDKPVFTSVHFNGDQKTLRSALDAVARNAAGRAVRRAWEAAHPKEVKARAPRATSSTKAEIEAIRQEMAADRAVLMQLLNNLTGDKSSDDVVDGPAAPKPRVRIARS